MRIQAGWNFLKGQGFIWGMSGKGERVMSEVQTKGRRPVQNSSPWIACFSPYLWVAAILVLTTTGAYAEEGGKAAEEGGKASEVIFLVELLALMVVGRLFGEAMNRIGQPSVMGPLLAGILLGPSVLGWLWPDLQHWIFPPRHSRK